MDASPGLAPPQPAMRDIRRELGLRPIINASGTMTVLGASIMVPEAIAAMAAIAGEFVEMQQLHQLASDAVAKATGAEAGFITASCASAITLAVAATLTGDRLLAIERLPDTTGLKHEVLVQFGHMVGYGASLAQTIAMTGARVVPVGTVSMARDYQLDEAITERTACAVFVVSHMTVQYAMLSLEQVCRICHAKGVPVIVDAGIGSPSHAAEALEMGASAVLVNTAIAVAGDPIRMAIAFKMAVEAGRIAYEAKLAKPVREALASSPLTSFLD